MESDLERSECIGRGQDLWIVSSVTSVRTDAEQKRNLPR